MTVMTLGITELADRLAACPSGQPGRTLKLIASIVDKSDREIAERLGKTRAFVQQKRTGKREMGLEDLVLFSRALDELSELTPEGEPLPPAIFTFSPKDATLWLLEHRPHLFV
ncbi:MAG: hypothetical protein AAF531_05595 [Actinomycetota bacterium]